MFVRPLLYPRTPLMDTNKRQFDLRVQLSESQHLIQLAEPSFTLFILYFIEKKVFLSHQQSLIR